MQPNPPSLQHSTTPSEPLVSALLKWFSISARNLPWRRTRDPYAIWVSEIMLQQTQVKTVIPYWERWMDQLPTVHALAEASSETIHKLWEGLGYYTRVRNMQKAAQAVMQQHAAQFPRNFNDVLALPGIGRYTAGAICSIAYNQPTAILDGNVIRVLTRVFGIAENPRDKKTNESLWQHAQELVSIAATKRSGIPSCSYLNQSLMELGALVCTPRQPECSTCPVQKMCVAHRENRIAELPNLGERQATTTRRFEAFIVEKRGRYLVQQRPGGVVNGHLWEFPNFETATNVPVPFEKMSTTPFCRIKHSITRYRITLEAFRAKLPEKFQRNGSTLRWCNVEELERLPFPSAHKKIVKQLASKAR